MIAIFILVWDLAIQCINTVCQQVSSIPVKMMLEVGTLEVIFEIGLLKILAHRRRK